jgi:hypothetical protein
VITPDIPNPLGTMATQSNHEGVCVLNVAMIDMDKRALAAIEIVSQ